MGDKPIIDRIMDQTDIFNHNIRLNFVMCEQGLILLYMKTMESLQNGVATHFEVTPLFSVRTVFLASSQCCRSTDADAWCKWAKK